MTDNSQITAMKLCLERAARTLKYLPNKQTDRHQNLRSIWGNIGGASHSLTSNTGIENEKIDHENIFVGEYRLK